MPVAALTAGPVSDETDVAQQFERELRATFIPGVTSDLSEDEFVEAMVEAKPVFDEELRRDRRLRTYVVRVQTFGRARKIAYPGKSRGRGEARPSGRRVRAVASSSGTDPPRLEDDDPDPLEWVSDVARCAVCGCPLTGRRRQTRTCSDAHRKAKSRRQSERTNNGDGNGHRPLTPRELAWLRDRVARARLELAGGYQVVERAERDLGRATRRLAAAA